MRPLATRRAANAQRALDLRHERDVRLVSATLDGERAAVREVLHTARACDGTYHRLQLVFRAFPAYARRVGIRQGGL